MSRSIGNDVLPIRSDPGAVVVFAKPFELISQPTDLGLDVGDRADYLGQGLTHRDSAVAVAAPEELNQAAGRRRVFPQTGKHTFERWNGFFICHAGTLSGALA